MPDDDELDPDFEELLAFLRESRGVDFTGYKRTSLRRLVLRRMGVVGVRGVRDYLDLLEVDQPEVHALFDSLLINVTAFFRDAPVWTSLRDDVVPALLERLGDDEPVRAWSAACATGQEAYSLAMLLHGVLGDADYHRRVKIYATDVDEAALAVARTGRYRTESLDVLTEEQRATYFTRQGEEHVFRADLRQSIIFGRHDLLADAPISRISLLLCRNALMYFTAETQARILERFAFALHDQGVLVLGKAEMLLTHNELFGALELSRRIFRSTRRPGIGRFMGFGPAALARQAATRQVTEAVFLHAPDAQLVLDADQRVALVNDRAVSDLGIRREDVGRSFHEYQVSYQPAELRPVVAAALSTGEPGGLADVRWTREGHEDRWWDIHVSPLPGSDEPLGVTVVFADVTRYHELSTELSRAHTGLQEAYEELQSSSEELETTNEELQSAIEELETTNEELQSTNEELETMNEELQSSNEEMQTVNDELRERTSEVGEMNAFLESVLSGLQTAVVVVDRDLKVLVWSARCEQLWGLRTFEVEGRHLGTLGGGLPAERLVLSASAVLRASAPIEPEAVVAVNRLGQQMLVTTAASPLRDRSGLVRGAILTMEEHPLEDGAERP